VAPPARGTCGQEAALSPPARGTCGPVVMRRASSSSVPVAPLAHGVLSLPLLLVVRAVQEAWATRVAVGRMAAATKTVWPSARSPGPETDRAARRLTGRWPGG